MKTTDRITEVLEHIYGRVRDKINPSLTQITAMLSDLGNPQLDYPTYHLIGTNGKGSCARMLAALLEGEGLSTGLYTSPHLISARERIIFNNRPIETGLFLNIWEELRDTAQKWDATFFEVFTVMAFLCFRNQQAEAAVIEAGLGGTWDATTVIQPEVVVLTAVQLDHTGRLGNTLEKIARDKSGAMKKGVPFICGERDERLRLVLREEADRRGARFYRPEELVELELLEETPCQTRLQVSYPGTDQRQEALLPLSGSYQVENFQAAVAAFCAVHGRPPAGDLLDLTPWPWPGRLDQVSSDPLTIVDTAHNPDAARSLFRAVRSLYPDRNPVVLYGSFADKDWREYLQVIAEYTDRIHPLLIPYRRGLAAVEMAEGVGELFPAAPAPVEFAEAWHAAVAQLQPDELLLVCGSFHIAEAAYRQLNLDPFTRGRLEE